MKKIITILTILIYANGLLAQNVTYDLRWNASSSEYEFYISRDIIAAAPITTGGTSTVTIVFPTDGVAGTRTVAHTNESVSTYNLASVIRSPGASSSNDYYVFNSTGGASYIGVLNANVEVLWMTFTASDGNSQARLFVNDSDPNSADTGMMGINARQEFNIFTTSGVNDEYFETLLSTPKKELVVDFLIYPNPTSDAINIESTQPINEVKIYNLLGKLVLTTTQKNINMKYLSSGIYLLKIETDKGSAIKRVVKK